VSVRDTIIESAARALWLCAYADHVEDFQEHKSDYPKREWKKHFCPASLRESAKCPTFGTHARPGPGEDWMDYAPPTGEPARAEARKLIAEIEKRNKIKVEDAYAKAEAAEGHLKEPTPEDFGHYLAMQALGHGVAWADDHPDHDLDLPLIEFGSWEIPVKEGNDDAEKAV
jgi:hypothetical protein